ncbi:MAG: pyridoxal-5'-phosphate-dependent protein [Tagaea sp. CACIAM 22H2]|jgi:threonine dehydratase|nr:pyridoxal-5'-phosphate-dependent protein [Tagaea sp. CACIAM 22H2]
MKMALPVFDDVVAAAKRLEGFAVKTPLLEAPLLNAKLGGRLLLKAEPLQRTGSFKFRGAYNAISQIPADKRKNGVVAFSSGNHAQGVAAAAQMLGMPAWIIMPEDAPAIKIARTKAFGATVVPYDRYTQDREKMGQELQAKYGATLVKPYDDPNIIAGQGTVGLEIAQQCQAMGVTPDAVVVCCGGGGLVSGTALALSGALPGVPVYSAEPAGFDDTKRSLEAGTRVKNDPNARSICDALLAPTPGEMTFALNSKLLKGGFAVTDEEVKRAMATLFQEFKLVAEPGGAVAATAVLAGKLPIKGKTVVAVVSGGNVDPATFADALSLAA